MSTTISLKDALKAVEAKFVKSKDTTEAIMLAHQTGQPVLLHGPPGHGKTQIAAFLGKMLYPDQEVRVVLYGRGTIPSAILGGVDFVKYKDDGLLQYQPHRSWMACPMVISEEFLDAPKTTIEQLKYIMSERRFPLADGSSFELKTQLHVGCTNYKPSKWADNESDRALLGRFPIKLEVKWASYEPADFQEMIEKYHPGIVWDVAEAAALCHAHGVKITPRDVMHIVKQFLAWGSLDVFRFHEEVADNPHLVAEIMKMSTRIAYRGKVRQVISAIITNINKLPKPGKNAADIVGNQQMIKVLNDYERNLQAIRTDDSTIEDVNKLLRTVREKRKLYQDANDKAAQLSLGQAEEFQIGTFEAE